MFKEKCKQTAQKSKQTSNFFGQHSKFFKIDHIVNFGFVSQMDERQIFANHWVNWDHRWLKEVKIVIFYTEILTKKVGLESFFH